MIVRAADRRISQTPNAVMTTLASPTLGEAPLAMWRVEMEPGAAGPEHTFDGDQVWTVEDGAAVVITDGVETRLAPGDTLVLRARVLRRIHADQAGGLRALVVAPPGGRALLADGTDRGAPPWTV